MARIRYDEEKYIYGSTRVRAVEARISAGERIWRAAEAKSLADALRVFEEFGIRIAEGIIEDALSTLVDDAYKILDETAPEPALFNVLRYPYDCHNIKSAIKCSFKGTDAAHLMFNNGSILPLNIINMVREREFSHLPRNMAEAAVSAYEVYYRNSDPQQIDLVLDNACFLDMIDSSEKYDLPYLRNLVAYKADTINILTCVRLIRMSAASASLERILLPGGIIKNELFKAVFNADGIKEREALLYDMLRKTRYRVMKLNVTDSLTAVERSCENTYLAFIRAEAKKKLYGAEILSAFVIARETEVKNIRIVIAGRAASLPADIIKERLRTYA